MERLIDADALIAELKATVCKECDSNNGIRCDYCWCDDVIGFLQESPTVDARPVVHGQWLDGCAIHNGKEVYKSIDCSHCEEVFKIESHDREYWKKRFKNCPFCGSQMDGGDGE